MSTNLKELKDTPRLLFSIPLKPLQGQRFQPTGFPGLGAARYETNQGESLLVESCQSMANRLEMVCWDEAQHTLVKELQGLSHVTVSRNGEFFTDTVLEAHRLNSPYLLEGSDKTFIDLLKADLGNLGEGPVNRRLLAEVAFRYDVGSLLHGLFLAKKDLAGGRLRLPRAISAFIEADGIKLAASGGVKNDHVNPAGNTQKGYGNVPFARDEYVADEIKLHVNLDLALLRSYGLDDNSQELLVAVGLYKLAAFLNRGMRLRTACDFEPKNPGPIFATRPEKFKLPTEAELATEIQTLIGKCKEKLTHLTVTYEDKLLKGKETEANDDDSTEDPE
jgi:CRISPR-associated protein Csb1